MDAAAWVRLFWKTLFSSPDPYISIVEALFTQKRGMTREEIAKSIGKSANGRLSSIVKYSELPYLLTKDEFLRFQQRLQLFQQQSQPRGGIIPTFITTYGLQRNAYSEHVACCLTLDDLFLP